MQDILSAMNKEQSGQEMEYQENKDFLIIAVIYNTYEKAISYITSLSKFVHINLNIVLVDNSAVVNEGAVEKLIAYENVEYIKPPENLGYFGGANYGFNHYLKRKPLPNFVIISNVDLSVQQNDFFDILINFNFKSTEGVIAPAIISNRWKNDINPKIIKRYTKREMKFFLFVSSNILIQNFYILASYLKKILLRTRNVGKKSERQFIYAPHGSFIIFRDVYFKSGGTLNHISFLFGEEIFVAESVMQLGLKTLYLPELVILDDEHASTGIFYSRKITKLMKQSTIDILKAYYVHE